MFQIDKRHFKELPMSNLKCRTMIRSSFSILFAIRESKVKKNGNAPIEVTITLNGERSYFSTGKSILVSKWDKTRPHRQGSAGGPGISDLHPSAGIFGPAGRASPALRRRRGRGRLPVLFGQCGGN